MGQPVVNISYYRFGESVVKLDVTYRHLKIELDDPINIKEKLRQMKSKGSFMCNTLRICFVLVHIAPISFVRSFASEILYEWKDYVYGLDIKFCFSLSYQVSLFCNLEYLQMRSPVSKTKLAKELITKNADTLKTLHIFNSDLYPELQCKKFAVLQELKVSGVSMSSMISLLGFCCETLIHLDVLMEDSESSDSQVNDLDCQFPSLKYLTFRGVMNSLYVIILRLCANQLIGMKFMWTQSIEYLEGLEMPNLKFLNIINYSPLINSCPKLEFLKIRDFSIIHDSSRPKLTNLKALIVSKYQENENGWISNAIKSSRENLKFIHVDGLRKHSEM